MTRTILLADDSVTIQKVIELTFMDEDYQVVAVGNGDEAIEKLDEITPDFVIADVHMPGASGYEVARQSKSLRPEVPVLLLVSTFEPFDEEEAERSGCDAFLKKPFDSQELQRLVEELSAEAQGDATAEGPSPWGEPEAEEPATSRPRFEPEPAAEPGARAGFGPEADEDETEPFSIGLGEDEEPPPTQVPPPSEELQSAEGWELEPAGEAWATEASPELFELEPEAELEVEEPAGEPPTEPAEALPAAGPLSDADVDRIARRVVELLGDKPVRDVAWEVVPDLAEVVIRARLQELESQVEPAE